MLPESWAFLHLFPQLFGGCSGGMTPLEEVCYSRQASRVKRLKLNFFHAFCFGLAIQDIQELSALVPAAMPAACFCDDSSLSRTTNQKPQTLASVSFLCHDVLSKQHESSWYTAGPNSGPHACSQALHCWSHLPNPRSLALID